MRIAFITDPHVGHADEKPMGVDVRQNFLNALAFLAELKPSCLVLGGDLCHDFGDAAIYEWMAEQVAQLPYPCYAVSGNHDDSELLANAFRLSHHLHGSELYYAIPLEGRPALFLDTSRGKMSATQWTWLREFLGALRDSNVLIFMHHPPLPADVRFMDTHYAFDQPDEFMALVRDLPCQVTVVCGHYHVEKIVQRGNILELLSPSTFYQMRPDTTEFTVDHYRVGIREISLTSQGINSEVHYL